MIRRGGGTGIEHVDLVKTSGPSGSEASYYKWGHLVLLVMKVVTTETSKSAKFIGAPPSVAVIYEYKHTSLNQEIETYVKIGTDGNCNITYTTSSIGVNGIGTLLYLTSE